MDIAGTAVGIASLGIQICQGLLSYYDAWKAYDSVISSTHNAITDLSKTLTILKTTLQQEPDKERVGRVRTCVNDCEDALLELEKRRYSLQKYDQPEGLRRKMRAGIQRTWYPFRKETLETLKASVTDIQDRLKLALQVLQFDTGSESQRLVLRLLSQAGTQSDSIARIADQNQRILDAHQSDEFRKIVAWLAPSDPGTNHATARQRHESQTGDWLLKSTQYQSWKTGAVSHLWMYGKAGSGKTVLCSTAIEDIRNTFEHDPDISHAFFYFSFSDEHKQYDGDLLLSLVAQLGWREPGLSMLRQAFGHSKRSVPRSDQLEKILLASIRSCGMVYLFVDALDECPEDQDARQNVLDRIEKLTQGVSNLKVFATSRELPTIRDSMRALGCEPLRIATSAVDADILTYVANQLLSDRSFSRFGSATVDAIKATIANKSDGMFRWAYCQLQALKKLRSTAPKYVTHALNTLPATLDDTYTRVLLDIEDVYHEHALTLLRWLAYARSPPTLGELVEAAIINPIYDSSIDVVNRGDLEDTLHILSGLVMVEWSKDTAEESNWDTPPPSPVVSTMGRDVTDVALHDRTLTSKTRVRLAHFSVKEYLESERILGSKANQFYLECATGHQTLAQSCLTYLRYYSISNEKTSTRQDLEKFPMLKYAAESWFYHSALQYGVEGSREASLLLLERARNDWLLVHKPDMPWTKPFNRQDRLDPGSAMYYASLLGLPIVVSSLSGSGAEVNDQGGIYGNALQAASVRGHIGIVQLLLDKGADVNAQGGEYGNALQAASARGHTGTVQLLLNNGADVNAQGGLYGVALYAASEGGHKEIVRLLLDKDADANSQGGEYDNAFQAASRGGHKEIVQLLLDKGADVNAQGGEYGNALYAASAEGHTTVVQLLLDKDADVNAQGGEYGNALYAASVGGHTEIVQLLLDKGVDITTQGGEYGNALQAASRGGHTTVVQLMLDKGAGVNAQCGRYSNALQAASAGGHMKVVQHLLDKGAAVNAQGGEYGSALQAASRRGYTTMVQLLLDKGADVNTQCGRYSNALQAASRGGHKEIVQLLLNKNADVNAQGGEYGNALYIASAGGHTEIVQLLIDKGADINAQGGEYCNALQAASFGGHTQIVQLLLGKGANVNAQDCSRLVFWKHR